MNQLIHQAGTNQTCIKWHHCQGPLRGHESAGTPIWNVSMPHSIVAPTQVADDTQARIERIE